MIAGGHAVEAVWGYTPRQLAAYLTLAMQRQKTEHANALALNALAGRGDPKDITKQIRELNK